MSGKIKVIFGVSIILLATFFLITSAYYFIVLKDTDVTMNVPSSISFQNANPSDFENSFRLEVISGDESQQLLYDFKINNNTIATDYIGYGTTVTFTIPKGTNYLLRLSNTNNTDFTIKYLIRSKGQSDLIDVGTFYIITSVIAYATGAVTLLHAIKNANLTRKEIIAYVVDWYSEPITMTSIMVFLGVFLWVILGVIADMIFSSTSSHIFTLSAYDYFLYWIPASIGLVIVASIITLISIRSWKKKARAGKEAL